MILHQVESLAAAGVTDIVLAVNYRPEVMTAALKKVCLQALLTETQWLSEHLRLVERLIDDYL